LAQLILPSFLFLAIIFVVVAVVVVGFRKLKSRQLSRISRFLN